MALRDVLKAHRPPREALEFLRYLGPGLLVTVGFIDPGNWAANIAAGSRFGYSLLWVITLSTLLLVVLQHNVAHLGIATGLCLSEAAVKHLRPAASRLVLASAVLASIATAFAEVLGAAVGLRMLIPGLPLAAGAGLAAVVVIVMLFTNSYPKIERWVIAFVSLIGLAFLYELHLVHVSWGAAAAASVRPSIPAGSMLIVMSVLGAVVMPHNLFLHSEIIQSRQWNTRDGTIVRRRLRFEFMDTLFSMGVGWAINGAMILVAAATFFRQAPVLEIEQAHDMLGPLVGSTAAAVFALALLFAGISSTVTAGMAGGTIFAALFGEPFTMQDIHTRIGAALTIVPAALAVLVVGDPFRALLISQMLLSVQLPVTIICQIRLTSSAAVMGEYANGRALRIVLWTVAAIVIGLNVLLVISLLTGRV